MARQRTSVFEDIMEISASLPWWLGVLLAIILYVWLHSVASQAMPVLNVDPKQVGAFYGKQLWWTFAQYLQYILPACCLIGAGVSAYRQRRKRFGGIPDKPDTRTTFTRTPQNIGQQPAHPAQRMACPVCGAAMVKRQAKKGANAGQAFWGCSQYPKCRGTRPLA